RLGSEHHDGARRQEHRDYGGAPLAAGGGQDRSASRGRQSYGTCPPIGTAAGGSWGRRGEKARPSAEPRRRRAAPGGRARVGGRGRWQRPLALPITLGIQHANQKPFVGWCRRLGVPEEAQVPRRLNALQDGKGEEGTGREGTAARACYSSKPLPLFCNCSNS